MNRARMYAVLGFLLAGGVGIISSTQTWITLHRSDAAAPLLVSGAEVMPLLAPLSLAVLALGGALSIAGRALLYVFAVIGLDGYRRTVADSVTEVVVGGVASAPGAAPQTLRERSYEVAAGAGYRYTVRLSSNWGIGAGGWSTVSAHYLRAGLEAPVTFTPIRWLRLEVLPSMRYSRVHSGAALTGERRVLSSGDEETIQRVTTPDGDGAVDIGIGFGASLVW